MTYREFINANYDEEHRNKILANFTTYREDDIEEEIAPIDLFKTSSIGLKCLFIWAGSPEGLLYWETYCDHLKAEGK